LWKIKDAEDKLMRGANDEEDGWVQLQKPGIDSDIIKVGSIRRIPSRTGLAQRLNHVLHIQGSLYLSFSATESYILPLQVV
jgi:hypothetical protein